MAVEIKIIFGKDYQWSKHPIESFYQMTMTKVDGDKVYHQTLGLSTEMIEQDNPMQILSVLKNSLEHLFIQDLTEEQKLMKSFPTIEDEDHGK